MAIFSVVRKQNDIDSLQAYKTFDGLKPLQTTVKAYKNMIEENESITKSMKDKLIKLLNYLRKHSLVVCGVSWISQTKIAKALGVSKRQTIGEWIARLEELGFIKRFKAKRSSDNRRTTDLIVIQPLPVKESGHKEVTENGHKEAEKSGHQEELPSLKSSSLKSFKDNVEDTDVHNTLELPVDNLENHAIKESTPFDADAVHTEIPKSFVTKLATRFNNATIIEEFWNKFKMAFKHSYKADAFTKPEEYADNALNIALAVIRAAQQNKLRKGQSMDAIYGAFYGLCRKEAHAWSRQRLRGSFYNFLEA